jgi:hypothetical protein
LAGSCGVLVLTNAASPPAMRSRRICGLSVRAG